MNGEVIKDCTFDKKTGIIKIPASYYKNNKEREKFNVPVAVEFLSRTTNKELKNLSLNVEIKNYFTKKTSITTCF